MHVLIVEDNEDVQDLIAMTLQTRWQDVAIQSARTGAEGLEDLDQQIPDIVILDLGLPDMDGLHVCEEIRKRSSVPVLILTARDRETDIVRALNTGADDYMSKPFSGLEFLARVQALLRRSQKMPGESSFESAGLTVDFNRREVRVQGQQVGLTPTEFRLLEVLVRNADRVVPHESILERVWGPQYVDATDNLKSHIRRLRKKIGDHAENPTMIFSERGVGYRFVTGT